MNILSRKRRLWRYAVYSVNHDSLMEKSHVPVVYVDAIDEQDMYKKLDHMTPVKPTEFLIFEKV